MDTGRIIKIISNHYTIDNGHQQVIAKPAGKLRKGNVPVVGDLVDYDEVQGSYRIQKIHPRKNRLLRPAAANVDQALIVTSCKDPDFSTRLLDRLIFLVVLAGVKPAIVITKYDLLSQQEQEKLEAQLDWYRQAGYEVVYSYPGSDDEPLKELLKDRVSVLCGQSGAGKSSLLNRLEPGFELAVQEISKALGRGRHTTRHCELHPAAQGLVADTPGFSSLDFTRLDISSLKDVILDFQPYQGQCRFSDCSHIHEPDCVVRTALEQGQLNPFVYEDYVQLIREAGNGR